MFDKLLYLLFDTVAAIIIVGFYARLFKFRLHKFFYFVPITIFVILSSFIGKYSDKNQTVNFFLTFFLMLIILLFFKSAIQGVLYAFILEVLMLLSDAAVFYLFSIIWSKELFLDPRIYPFAKLTIFILMAISAYFVAKVLSAIQYQDIPKNYWVLLLIIPLGCIVLIYSINGFYKESQSMLFEASISMLFLFGMFVGSIIIYGRIVDYFIIKLSNQVISSRLEAFGQKQNALAESSRALKDIQHNLINKLVPVSTAIDDGDINSAKNELAKILGEIGDIQNIAYTGIDYIDDMLNYKKGIARKSGIAFRIDCEMESNMQVPFKEISVAIGIALDNAIEACQREGSGKEISIDISCPMGILSIRIENDLVNELRTNECGDYLTTKPDADNHGLGIKSIRNILNKCGGNLKIEPQDGKFVLKMICGSVY